LKQFPGDHFPLITTLWTRQKFGRIGDVPGERYNLLPDATTNAVVLEESFFQLHSAKEAWMTELRQVPMAASRRPGDEESLLGQQGGELTAFI